MKSLTLNYPTSLHEIVNLFVRPAQDKSLPPSVYFTLYRAKSCVECNEMEYNGRVGIHELLVPNATMRKSINASGITAEELNRQAVEECSMTTLYCDAMEKVRERRCSIEDVLAKVRIDEFDARPE